jgi:hypothetical protein
MYENEIRERLTNFMNLIGFNIELDDHLVQTLSLKGLEFVDEVGEKLVVSMVNNEIIINYNGYRICESKLKTNIGSGKNEEDPEIDSRLFTPINGEHDNKELEVSKKEKGRNRLLIWVEKIKKNLF